MRNFLFILMLMSAHLCAQNDWKEYGYFGKVKRMQLTRTTTEANEKRSIEIVQTFDSNGFEDTFVLKNYVKNELINQRIRIYLAENNKKTGWKEFNADFVLQTYATIEWLSDSLYIEKAYNADSSCKSKSIYHLNKNGNTYKVENWEANADCEMHYESLILFNRTAYGPANKVSIVYSNNDPTDITTYTILKRDVLKNPIHTTAVNGKKKINAFRTYTYY